jgi:hypothetical protein
MPYPHYQDSWDDEDTYQDKPPNFYGPHEHHNYAYYHSSDANHATFSFRRTDSGMSTGYQHYAGCGETDEWYVIFDNIDLFLTVLKNMTY